MQLDVNREIEAAELGPLHWVTVFFLGLVTLFDGYDVFVPAYVIHYTMQPWHLSPSEAGLMMSSGLAGFMVGSIASGAVADRVGRKPTMLVALLAASLLNLVTAAFASGFHAFLVLRFFTGIGLGVLLPVAVTLVNEIAPRRSTNMLVGYVMVGWSAGGILAAVLGIWLTPDRGWPALFWVAGAGIPLAILAFYVLPESPRFLALRGRDAGVRAILSRLTPRNTQRYATATFTMTTRSPVAGSIATLLTSGYRRNTLVVWLCSGCSLFVIFGLSSWVPNTMIQRGESFGSSFAFGALLQCMAILGGVACGWAADRLGQRRGTLAVCWIVGACAIAGLGLFNVHWSNLLFVAVAGFCIMGAQPVLNNLTASLYHTEIRGTGVGMELGVGRIGGILGPYAGGALQQIFPGPFALYLTMAVAVAVSATSLLLLRPDLVVTGAGTKVPGVGP